MEIKPEGLKEAIQELIDIYADEVADILEKEAKETAKEAAKMLVQDSPRDSGGYAESWKSEVTLKGRGSVQATVYNEDKPGLIHLLEDGHMNRDGSRTPGRKHVDPVAKWAEEEFMKRLEEYL